MVKLIKQFCLNVFKKITDNLATVVALGLISLSIVFWKWLLKQYTITAYGLVWIIFIMIIIICPIFVLILIQKRKQKILYTNDGDIFQVIENQLRKLENQEHNQIAIDYRIWDKKLKLNKGSTKRLLLQVLKEDHIWKIKKQSENYMTIINEPAEFELLEN